MVLLAEAMLPPTPVLKSLQKRKQGRMGGHVKKILKILSLNIGELSKTRRQVLKTRSLGGKVVSLGHQR